MMKTYILTILIFLGVTSITFGQISYEEVEHSFEEIRRSHVEFADVNGNGHLDVLIMGYKTDSGFIPFTGLYINDGEGNFTLSDNPELLDLAYASASFADIDGDGDLDLIISGSGNGVYTKIYINDGDGYFTEAEEQPINARNDVIFADFNGDGYPDILASNNSNHVYINDGSGNFNHSYENDIPTDISINYSIKMAVADVNGNGHLDILLAGQTQEGDFSIKLYLNDGEAHFTEASTPNLTPVVGGDIAFGDIDGDGYPDLITSGLESFLGESVTKLYKNDGEGGFIEVENHPLDPMRQGDINFVDVDNDGDLDVLITGSSLNDLMTNLYENDGDGNFTLVECTDFMGLTDSGAAFGDVDGDGFVDLIATGAGVDSSGGGFGKTNFYINKTREIQNLIPELELEENPISLCNTQLIDATPNNADDFDEINYEWSLNDNELSSDSSEIEITEVGNYTVLITGIIYCNDEIIHSETTEVVIEVVETPFEVDLGPDIIICDEDYTEINATLNPSDSDANFQWVGPEGEINENSPSITITEPGIYTVAVTIDDCTTTDSISVQFEDSPIVDLGNDISTSNLEDYSLNASPENFNSDEVQYEWEYDGGNGSQIVLEDGPIVNPIDYGFGVYTVTVSTKHTDCATIVSINISEKENNCDLNLSADKKLQHTHKFCPDKENPKYEITFKVDFLIEDSTEEPLFIWYQNNEIIEGVSGDSYTLTYENEGIYNDDIKVEIESSSCNQKANLSTAIEITPYENPCQLPEGISPGNNDGINDFFNLEWLANRSGIKYIEIYNRYGVKIFSQNNYSREWNGQTKNGKHVPSGTYYYILRFKNTDPVFGKKHRGWIYVNR